MNDEKVCFIAQYLSDRINSVTVPEGKVIARQAFKGINAAGNPQALTDIRKAAYQGISWYFCAWGDWYNKELSDVFMEALENMPAGQ